MANTRLLPDVATLLQLKGKGLTHQQIADQYGASRQAVTLALKGAAESRNYRRDWPWTIEPRHKDGWFYDALSDYQITQTKERLLNDVEKGRLQQLMDRLDALRAKTGQRYVVDYDPATAMGFTLRPSVDGDRENTIIGRPQYV